jgi:hypothetical protein
MAVANPQPAPTSERHSDRPLLTRCPLCHHEHFSYQFTDAHLPIVRCDGCSMRCGYTPLEIPVTIDRDRLPKERKLP